METIIKKAIEGGWKDKFKKTGSEAEFKMLVNTFSNTGQDWCLDPLFWQALGKACGWRVVGPSKKDNDHNDEWYYNALKFHEINLTEGWGKAVKHLSDNVKTV